eukprot:SAG31_NODE_4533_length_3158_cov_3.140569_2_plen_192_part_00
MKLLNTLGHELCHAATWVVSKSSEGHGNIWAGWMRRVHVLYPGFDLSTRHGYSIHKPYRWECTACTGYEQRHSKSVHEKEASCRHCGKIGTLRFLGRFDKDGKPIDRNASGESRPLSAYAQFTKQHMAAITAELPRGTPQKEKMKELGRRWQEHKAQAEVDDAIAKNEQHKAALAARASAGLLNERRQIMF